MGEDLADPIVQLLEPFQEVVVPEVQIHQGGQLLSKRIHPAGSQGVESRLEGFIGSSMPQDSGPGPSQLQKCLKQHGLQNMGKLGDFLCPRSTLSDSTV